MGEAAGQTLAGAKRNPLGNDRYGFSCDSAGFYKNSVSQWIYWIIGDPAGDRNTMK